MKIPHFLHCWHEILNTRRALTRVDRCKRIGETRIHNGGFVRYKVDEECCICNKKITSMFDDYDTARAWGYPTEKEYIKNARNT